MSKQWSYTDVAGCRTGTMICGACSKPIEGGAFRYRQKSSKGDWGYVQQHRACSQDDPKWLEMDAARAASDAHQERFIAACIAFREQWGVDELDSYIDDAVAEGCAS